MNTVSLDRTEYDYLFKIIIIGDSGIGKSAILFRFADDLYNDGYISTIGVDFKIRTILVNGKIVKLQIWDTAGQERFRTITTSYYRGSHIIFMCYDITDRKTFSNLNMWKNEIKKFANLNIKVVLCGTKMDLSSQRQVSEEEGNTFAINNGYTFFEVSAKYNKNIDELFEKTSEELLNNFLIELKNKNNIDDKVHKNINPRNTIKITKGYKDNFNARCC
jgi:Ras-related protein Rab-1A